MTTLRTDSTHSGITIDYADGSGFVHGGSGPLTVYSDDEKAAINALTDADDDTYYLFLVSSVIKLDADGNNTVVSGYMPVGYQHGFIFEQFDVARTYAHELSHGAFALHHTFSTNTESFRADEGTTTNLMDYTEHGIALNHKQWRWMHEKHGSGLFGFLADEEESEFITELVPDYGIYNYSGHEAILEYLLDKGKEDIIYELNTYQYFEKNNKDGQTAEYILSNVLGKIVVGDIDEAILLLEEFNVIYTSQKVASLHEDIMSLLTKETSSFPKQNIEEIIYKDYDYEYASSVKDFIQEIINIYYEIWESTNKIGTLEISKFREVLVNSLTNVSNAKIEITKNGLTQMLSKLSNTQFKELYRKVFPDVTDAQMRNIMQNIRVGTYDYSKLANNLKASDKIAVVNSLDDLTLSSICTPSNFNNIKNIDLPNVLTMSSNVLNFKKLIVDVMDFGVEVSPLDVLSLVPHPISLFSIWGNLIISNIEEQQGEFTWNNLDYSRLIEWNKKYKGTPGLPNEYLYVCYTDQKEKYNPYVLPTSIIFKNKQDAAKVFGYTPIVVDFDVKSSVYNNGNVNFRPSQQATMP